MSLLDIGAGIRPFVWKRWDYIELYSQPHVCVEPHGEYCDELLTMPDNLVVIQAKLQDVPALFRPRSFDHIVITDVIEHIDKDVVLPLIEPICNLARIGVHIMTPIGFAEQSGYRGDGKDPWGLNGQAWQKHVSGWTPDDFPGWHCVMGVENGKLFEAHLDVS